MDIKTAFEIEQIVDILPLDLVGTIEEINIDRKGVRYNVKYYYYMEAKYSYFTEKELKAREVTEYNGFLSNMITVATEE